MDFAILYTSWLASLAVSIFLWVPDKKISAFFIIIGFLSIVACLLTLGLGIKVYEPEDKGFITYIACCIFVFCFLEIGSAQTGFLYSVPLGLFNIIPTLLLFFHVIAIGLFVFLGVVKLWLSL